MELRRNFWVSKPCAANPGPHDHHRAAADRQRHPAALDDLHEIGRQKSEIDGKKAGNEESREPNRPAPAFPHDDESQRGGRHHCAGDRNAIGGGERTRTLEHQHQHQNAEQEQAIDAGKKDLTFLGLGCVQNEHPRQQPELDGLAHKRERAGDDGLTRDDRRDRGEDDKGQKSPVRREQEKWIVDGRRIGEDERPLAEIVQAQSRKHEHDPGGLNRRAAEMTHVRVKRLGPCHRQKHRAKHDETEKAVAEQKPQAVDGIEGAEGCAAHRRCGPRPRFRSPEKTPP